MKHPASLKQNNFEQLRALVSDNSLRIIDIDTVPRSVSTALGRALNESSSRSVYVHEPFDTVGQNINEAACRILAAAVPLLQPAERTTIITKNFARNLTGEAYENWRSVCDGVVYLVRDPRVQMRELLVRFANDLFIEAGADIMKFDEIKGEYLDKLMEFLASGRGSHFSRTSWHELGEHFKHRHHHQRAAIVDSLELLRSPENTLRSVCKELDLVFHDRMVHGWRNKVVNANKRTWNRRDTSFDRSPQNAWIGRAMFSKGFGTEEELPLKLNDVPDALRKHLIEVAFPVYQEIISSKKLQTTNLYWPQKWEQAQTPPLEIVEHKAEGHPDSVCDILSAATIDAYTSKLAGELGGTPHGSFDKVAIAGGEARIDFGSCEVIKPPTIYLFGKAMARNNSNLYMKPLFKNVVDEVLGDIFGRSLTGKSLPKADVNVVVDVNSGVGAEHDPAFYTATDKPVTELWDHRLSNDTIACAGWYPFTRHEKLTVELANYINGPAFKAEFFETGRDVKVMTTRLKTVTMVTLCVPFLAAKTPSFAYYEHRKAEIKQKVIAFVKERVSGRVIVHLNTKDVPGRGYLTVFGSAFDKGDCGMTGRGNRYPGFIALNRPSGVEAVAGKNPFNHTGRIYTAMAFDLAKLIYEQSGIATNTFVTALNGDALGKPRTLKIVQNNQDVTKLYQAQINHILQGLKAPPLSKNTTALEAFRAGHGLF